MAVYSSSCAYGWLVAVVVVDVVPIAHCGFDVAGPDFVHTALEQCGIPSPVYHRYGSNAETPQVLFEAPSPKEAAKVC